MGMAAMLVMWPRPFEYFFSFLKYLEAVYEIWLQSVQ